MNSATIKQPLSKRQVIQIPARHSDISAEEIAGSIEWFLRGQPTRLRRFRDRMLIELHRAQGDEAA